MPIPRFTVFIAPLLRVLADHPEGLKPSAAHNIVAARLGLTEAEMAELLPSGAHLVFRSRSGWAQDRLKRAGLTESRAGLWRITAAGLALLASKPGGFGEADIKQITAITDGRQAAPWRDRLATFRADTAWAQELEGTAFTSRA